MFGLRIDDDATTVQRFVDVATNGAGRRRHDHRVYADNNAETFECRECIAMREALDAHARGWIGNASSPHTEGRVARGLLEEARATVVRECSVPSGGTVVFTSGATESNRLAILGGVESMGGVGRARVLTTPIEHSSVSAVADAVGRTEVPVDDRGFVDTRRLLDEASDADVGVVSMILAHNEVGVVQRTADILAAVRRARRNREGDIFPLLHYDAAQLLGKAPVRFDETGADSMSWSAHKFNGPAGVGGLLLRDPRSLVVVPDRCQTSPHGQEGGMRSGTENVQGCVCAAVSLASSNRIGRAGAWTDTRTACSWLAAKVRTLGRDVVVLGDPGLPDTLCNTVHACLVGYEQKRTYGEGLDDGVAMVRILDEVYGVSMSTGSACLRSAPSMALLEMGLTEDQVRCAVRMSFSVHSDDIYTDVGSVWTALRTMWNN